MERKGQIVIPKEARDMFDIKPGYSEIILYDNIFCVFTYSWIMCLLFVVSGVSARYSLKKKNKEFIKDRTKRILIPSIVGIFTNDG